MSLEVDDWIVRKLFGSEAEGKLTDHELAQYLQQLSSCGVQQLAEEPQRLVEEKANLLDDTESLAFDNYNTFIQAANCSKEIYEDFTLVEERVNGLVEKLPHLTTECREFLQEANKIGGRRAANTLALSKHAQVLEVLEIPQVMDTCVRAGYWEEALELAQFVSKLQRRLSDIPLIQAIGVEVESQRKGLIEQLLDQLHTQLSLPQCLKVVGYLRRMHVCTEAELRIKFLLARDTWLGSVLGAIPADDPYLHVTRVMEQTRVHLFDIVTQYRAVFSDDDPVSSVPALREQIPTNLGAIFHSWIGHKIQAFVHVLETDLDKGVGARLDSVMAQCMYFGLSFGRVGIDFRPMVIPVFENAAFKYFCHGFQTESAKFVAYVSSESMLDDISMCSGPPIGTSTIALSPPSCLMDWPNAALICNHILIAFNGLRLCAPLSLACRVRNILQEFLLSSIDAIAAVNEKNRVGWNETQKMKIERACSLLVNEMCPFLNRVLEAIFPLKDIANILGYAVHNYHQLENKCRLNLLELRKPVDEICPEPTPVLSKMKEEKEEIQCEPAPQFSEPTPQFSEPAPQFDSEIESLNTVDFKPENENSTVVYDISEQLSEVNLHE